jgi:hypothetical protein
LNTSEPPPWASPGSRPGRYSKLRNHRAATALHFAHSNLMRRHQTLRITPAMAAAVTDTMWSMDQVLDAPLSEAA